MATFHALALPLLAAALGGVACDTHAVGVDECKALEQARCGAARGCDVGITDATQAECERFSRDNCLHGLPVAAAPKSSVLDNCIKAIRAAGSCAAGKGGPKQLAKDCSGAGSVTRDATTVCDIVEDPEQSSECDFLNQTATPAAATPKAKDAGHD
jgi:hypothetical protein